MESDSVGKPHHLGGRTDAPVMEKFLGTHYMCVKCKDIIYSRYQGEFVTCKCGAISVDQTRFYTRHIGNREDFMDVPSNMDPWPFPEPEAKKEAP